MKKFISDTSTIWLNFTKQVVIGLKLASRYFFMHNFYRLEDSTGCISCTLYMLHTLFHLQWSLSMQKAEGPYPRQSSAERKEALYHDIIEYFDKGKVSDV